MELMREIVWFGAEDEEGTDTGVPRTFSSSEAPNAHRGPLGVRHGVAGFSFMTWHRVGFRPDSEQSPNSDPK